MVAGHFHVGGTAIIGTLESEEQDAIGTGWARPIRCVSGVPRPLQGWAGDDTGTRLGEDPADGRIATILSVRACVGVACACL